MPSRFAGGWTVCLAVGTLWLTVVGCRTTIDVDRDRGFTAEGTEWAHTIHRWYPGQRRQLEMQAANEFVWAEDLLHWYPDWRPPLSARQPPAKTAPPAKPALRPPAEVARPAPRPADPPRPAPAPKLAPTAATAPTAAAKPPVTAATAPAPAPVVPPAPRPDVGGAPADTQAPLIVTEGGSPVAPTAAGSGMRRHVVRRGDSLHSISQRYYGTPDQWRRIYDANRSVIRNPNALTIDSALRIP